MERLTFDGNFCDIAQCRELPCPHGGSCTQRKVWEKLKAYEDLGLDPEEYKRALSADIMVRVAAGALGVPAEALRDMVELGKAGRLMVLPENLEVREDGEYIERWAALSLVKPDAPEDDECAVTIATAKKLVRDVVRRAPAADVAPVVHGRWAHLGGDEWCCSACGFIITTEGSWDKPTKKYCEDCGAKMDGGADDAKAD